MLLLCVHVGSFSTASGLLFGDFWFVLLRCLLDVSARISSALRLYGSILRGDPETERALSTVQHARFDERHWDPTTKTERNATRLERRTVFSGAAERGIQESTN